MQEKEYYNIIKDHIEKLLGNRVNNFHLEITANKVFTNHLKAEIAQHRDIIFHFLKKAAPDITGFIKKDHSSDFFVIEIKKNLLKLDDIYQARKYTDLFNSKLTFLISLKPIPEEIKRLHRVTYEILSLPTIYRAFVLAQFDKEKGGFVEWYPENPFEKDTYW